MESVGYWTGCRVSANSRSAHLYIVPMCALGKPQTPLALSGNDTPQPFGLTTCAVVGVRERDHG